MTPEGFDLSGLSGVLSFNVILAAVLFSLKNRLGDVYHKIKDLLFYNVEISDTGIMLFVFLNDLIEEDGIKYSRTYVIGNLGLRFDYQAKDKIFSYLNDARVRKYKNPKAAGITDRAFNRFKTKRRVSPKKKPSYEDMEGGLAALNIGYGIHFCKFKKAWFKIQLSLKGTESMRNREEEYTTCDITVPFFYKKRLFNYLELLKEETVRVSKGTDCQYVYVYNSDGNTTSLRSDLSHGSYKLDLAILDDDVSKEIDRDLHGFLSKEEQYRKWNIKYKRVYLFSGPPGTGKTTLSKAISREMGVNINIINLANLSDGATSSLIEDIASDETSVYLIEDVDSVFDKRKSESKEAIKFDMLLNILDGMLTPDNGSIIILTTNDINKIDPVLMRPGRVDKIIEFKTPSENQLQKLAIRFELPYDKEMFKGVKSLSEAQERIIEKKFKDRV